MPKQLRSLWPSLSLLLAVGCGEGELSVSDSATDPGSSGGETVDDSGDTHAASWTVFVYGHGDHTLSPSLAADMLEMARANLGDEVTVIVMADWNASIPGFGEGTEWYRIAGGGVEPELIDVGDEQNLDDPAVMRAAIARAFSDHPANNLGLVMWDHGGSWSGGFGGDTADGTEVARGVSARSLAAAIGGALADAGVERLRFLSFDTCLMAGVEVLAELGPLAEVYIANAEIDYGAGWDYEHTLSWLAQHPDADMHAFAAAEAEIWDAHHVVAGAEDGLLRSHAAIEMDAVPAFIAAFAEFTGVFRSTASSAVSVGRAAYFSLPGYWAEDLTSLSASANLRDAGQFLAAMAQSDDGELAHTAGAAAAALDAAILDHVSGALRSPFGQAGVHIELPSATDAAARLDAYRMLAPSWVAQTGWDLGLSKLVDLSDSVAPATITDLELIPGSLVMYAEDTDVAAADVHVAALDPVDPSVLVLLGIIGSGAIEPGSQYEFTWSGSLLEIGADDQAQRATAVLFARLSASNQDTLPLLAVPGRLVMPGESYEANLVLRPDDTTADVLTVKDGERVATIAAADAVGFQFIPLTPALSLDTGEEMMREGTPIDITGPEGIRLSEVQAPSGPYFLVTSAFDVWGNFEPVIDPIELP